MTGGVGVVSARCATATAGGYCRVQKFPYLLVVGAMSGVGIDFYAVVTFNWGSGAQIHSFKERRHYQATGGALAI